MSTKYRAIKMKYDLGKITAAQVWAHVPADITEEEAVRICGPRP